MKMYYAGSYTPRELEVLAEYKCPIMQNWSTVNMKDPLWKKIKTGEIEDVIFDSGGFQLQTRVDTTRVINLEHYALWLELALRDYPNIKYLCLDVKGDNLETMSNLIYLESRNLSPIPIWHVTNSEVNDFYLNYYCDNYSYIALGGIAADRRKASRLVEFIMQKYPHTDFHLLGIGSSLSSICRIYKPYSADSSSWLSPVRWGRSLVFDGKNLKPVLMSEEDRKAVRRNDELRTMWARKTIQQIQQFEEMVNSSEPNQPYQKYMF